jgi:hypothetical protein
MIFTCPTHSFHQLDVYNSYISKILILESTAKFKGVCRKFWNKLPRISQARISGQGGQNRGHQILPPNFADDGGRHGVCG